MRRVLCILAIICFSFLVVFPCEGQIWPFKKGNSVRKATDDLNERKSKGGGTQGNQFNVLEPFGGRNDNSREDQIWAAGTGAISPANAGNVSVTTPSRYGLNSGLELQSWLGLAYWAPNLFLKREISGGKLRVSSLHGLFSSSPGFQHVYDGADTFLADSLSGVPKVVSIKNQLLVSRPFYSSLRCNPKQPHLVLSASLALDYGMEFGNEDVYVEDQHFLSPRKSAYSGKGWLATLAFRGDWQIQPNFISRAEIRTLADEFTSNIFIEQQSSLEYFPFRNFSLSGGYVLSIGNLGPNNLGFAPFVDISFYFGSKSNNHRSLFGERIF